MSPAIVTGRLTVPVGPRDHVLGPATAPVTLLEYGDYQCPHCARAYPVVNALHERFARTLRVAYRHFPLTSIHPLAEQAAEAAEAADSQGYFWSMHGLLFESQPAFNVPDLVRYAASLGIDTNQFLEELVGHQHAPRVRQDFASGVRSGVNGTPTFFINNVRFDGAHDLGSMSAAIQRALEARSVAP
jgi:protein-disulfide isomerase